MSMYLHTPVLEVGSWWRVDTASGSDTATTVYAHDGTDAIPTGLGASGSTVRNTRVDGTALFWSSAATLYCKELTYQGVPNGTVVTSTGATPTTPGGAGTGGPVLGGPNVWTGTQDFTGATVTGVSGGGAASLLDRGNWASSTLYAVGDVTTQTGQRYAARVAHTSGTFATDLAASKWVALDTVQAIASGAAAGGDLSGTLPSPTVAKINGVAVSGTPTSGQVPTATSGSAATWQTPPTTADATTGSKGIVQLAGDIAGTAASPTVPGLAGKTPTTRTLTAGTGLTGGGDLTADRTLTVAYGTTSGTAAQGNDSRITGALQAANNLSDVTAASARSNLGLGTAATKSVGTTSTTVAAGDAPTTAAQTATLAEAFGVTAGSPISPQATPTTIGSERWATANFSVGGGLNSTLTAPTLTVNGTNNNFVTTRCALGNLVNQDTSFRIEFDWAITSVPSGWAGITMALTDTGGTLITGTSRQYVANLTSPVLSAHFVADFRPTASSIGSALLEIRLESYNNAPSGTVSISNVSLKANGTHALRPMLLSKQYSTGVWPEVHWQPQETKTNTWKDARLTFGTDGALTNGFTSIDAWSTDSPWSGSNYYFDPTFVRSTGGINTTTNNSQTGGTSYSLRVANNDQILEVWNGSAYELRCNTHGGETARSAATWKIDTGSGSLASWTLAHGVIPVRRFQASIPSQVAYSTGGTFANVDHTFTCFQDGTVRCDRTTTFLSDTLFRNQFEWMSSQDVNTPYLGRIGRGTTVLGELDTHQKVTAPTLTPSTSASGGTLAATTYSYKITAVTPYGESTPSAAVTQVTTGSTSTVTLTWSAASNASAYRIYGRTAGVESLLASIGAVTTWTDDGSLGIQPTAPPTVNTGRYYPGTTVATDAEAFSDASWAVWYEPRSGFCYANIYDRDSILARTGVSAFRVRIMASTANLIQKIYTNTYWTSGDTYTVPSGTVWTATHYSFVYLPYDPANFHREAAVRSANLTALAALYPNT